MATSPLLVGPGTVITNTAENILVSNSGVFCDQGRVVEVASWDDLRARHPDACRLDAAGRVILPGLINAHHHLYSTFARGMPIPDGTSLRNFPEILEGIWWRLDRALDLEAVEAGAFPPLLDGLRWGTTSIIDHHASPNAIRGSLDALARACEQTGVRASLCYELTDRNGEQGAQDGITENATFASAHKQGKRLSALLGLHASFTVSDASLRALAEASPDVPIHIHVAEDAADISRTRDLFGSSIIDRLQDAGLLRRGSLIVHGIHLEDDDLKRVAEAGCWLVHNPESNANNAVGHLDVVRAMELGARVALGTDGMAGNMLRAAKSAYLMARHARRDPTVGFDLPRKFLFESNPALARERFDEPLIGSLAEGAPADLCVLDYLPPTSLTEATFDGHLVFGMTEAPVLSTVSDGVVRFDRGNMQGIDEDATQRRVLAAARGVWKRLQAT